jgi:hypothetical protein
VLQFFGFQLDRAHDMVMADQLLKQKKWVTHGSIQDNSVDLPFSILYATHLLIVHFVE